MKGNTSKKEKRKKKKEKKKEKRGGRRRISSSRKKLEKDRHEKEKKKKGVEGKKVISYHCPPSFARPKEEKGFGRMKLKGEKNAMAPYYQRVGKERGFRAARNKEGEKKKKPSDSIFLP